MSTLPVPNPVQDDEETLVGDAWWDLFEKVRISRADAIAKQGGAVTWIRKLREADDVYSDADLP